MTYRSQHVVTDNIAIQFVPGIVLLPFDQDLPSELNVFAEGDALVNLENPVVDLKFGTVAPWSLYGSPESD